MEQLQRKYAWRRQVAEIGEPTEMGDKELTPENQQNERRDPARPIEPSREGRDALGALGLKRGLVAVNATGRGAIKTYGLGLLAADLRLDSKANITSTKAELSAAISTWRILGSIVCNQMVGERPHPGTDRIDAGRGAAVVRTARPSARARRSHPQGPVTFRADHPRDAAARTRADR